MTETTDNDVTPTKAPYEAPHVTDHGSLDDYTKGGVGGFAADMSNS